MRIVKNIYFLIEFIPFYILKLVQSNIYIAYDILTPQQKSSPVIVEVPLQIQSDFSLLVFTNLITMTPGTLTLDIDDDKKNVLVHVLYSKSKEAAMYEIDRLQQKIQQFIN